MVCRQMDDQYKPVIDKHVRRARASMEHKQKEDLLDYLLEEEILDFHDISSQIKTLVFAGTDTTSNSREQICRAHCVPG